MFPRASLWLSTSLRTGAEREVAIEAALMPLCLANGMRSAPSAASKGMVVGWLVLFCTETREE